MYRYTMCACIAMLAVIINVKGQTPTYQYTAFTGTNSAGGGNGQEFKKQGLYTKDNFPGMPKGRVKAIYIRVAGPYNTGQSTLCSYQQFTAKIGYTNDSAYKLATTDSFRTGLTTIYGPDTFSIPCSGIGGAWIKIPVTKGNFQYDPERFFAVEIACGPKTVIIGGFPVIANSVLSGGVKKSMYDYNRNAIMATNLGSVGMDLGLDLGQPADVEALSNLNAFSLFPNPAASGTFSVSFEAKNTVQQAAITVSDVTGRQVYSSRHANPGKSLSQEISLGGAAKGVYFVKLQADGEGILRRVILD